MWNVDITTKDDSGCTMAHHAVTAEVNRRVALATMDGHGSWGSRRLTVARATRARKVSACDRGRC